MQQNYNVAMKYKAEYSLIYCFKGETAFKMSMLSVFVLLTQYCAGGKIKKNEMGWACGAYGEGERCAQGVGGEA
jgi:hypothetical protein